MACEAGNSRLGKSWPKATDRGMRNTRSAAELNSVILACASVQTIQSSEESSRICREASLSLSACFKRMFSGTTWRFMAVCELPASRSWEVLVTHLGIGLGIGSKRPHRDRVHLAYYTGRSDAPPRTRYRLLPGVW